MYIRLVSEANRDDYIDIRTEDVEEMSLTGDVKTVTVDGTVYRGRAVILAMVLGISLGLLAGYRGGWVDSLIMRIADIQLSFPAILLALILLAFLRPGVGNIVIALVAVQWAYYARTTRGAAIVERLADVWHDPSRFAKVIDDLTLMDRPNRAGFPFPVLNELINLRDHYFNVIHPEYRDRLRRGPI